jgi:hypothetical protein
MKKVNDESQEASKMVIKLILQRKFFFLKNYPVFKSLIFVLR